MPPPTPVWHPCRDAPAILTVGSGMVEGLSACSGGPSTAATAVGVGIGAESPPARREDVKRPLALGRNDR